VRRSVTNKNLPFVDCLRIGGILACLMAFLDLRAFGMLNLVCSRTTASVSRELQRRRASSLQPAIQDAAADDANHGDDTPPSSPIAEASGTDVATSSWMLTPRDSLKPMRPGIFQVYCVCFFFPRLSTLPVLSRHLVQMQFIMTNHWLFNGQLTQLPKTQKFKKN
jgi:hypothetical protein